MGLIERLETEPLPTTPLFHYTDQTGLLGILKTNRLWATGIEYLNDGSEYSHGLELIRAALKERCDQTNDAADRNALDEFKTVLGRFQALCVASFTEEGDLLSQWRAYGGGSGGFALGFRPDHRRAVAHEQVFYLVKCIYSVKEQQRAIDELIDEWCERIRSGIGVLGSARLASLLAASLKDESFQEEREWRLIGIRAKLSDLDFRPGKSMLIPYFKFHLRDERAAYLQEVVVGPNPHGDLADHAVTMFLQKFNLSSLERTVRRTRIPYRNW